MTQLHHECQVEKVHRVGRGFLGGDEMTYRYEREACASPLFATAERERGTCRFCHAQGAETGRTYEVRDADGELLLVEIDENEAAALLAQAATVEKKSVEST